MRTALTAVLSGIILSLLACNVARPTSDQTQLNDLIAEGDAPNVALLMSALNDDEDDRWWSKSSIKELRTALKKIRGQDTLKITEQHDLTAPDLLKLTTEAAKQVGPDGTLIWYVASHGWIDGFATAGGGRVRPADIMAALKAGRTTPIKRLILFFDYCGSGGMVEGLGLQGEGEYDHGPEPLRDLAAAPGADPLSDAFFKALEEAGYQSFGLAGDGGPLYKSALYFSAAAKLQTTEGSVFTESMAAAVKANANQPQYKIRKFLNDTVKGVAANVTHEYLNNGNDHVEAPQKAVYRALPTDAFLDETLFSAP
jgi:hypothetical protein